MPKLQAFTVARPQENWEQGPRPYDTIRLDWKRREIIRSA